MRRKAVGSGIFGRFPNFDKCQLEEAADVISGVAVDYVGIDAVNIWRIWDKQWPNYSTRWPVGPVLRNTFVQYLFAFYSRPEATSDVISDTFVGPVISDNRVKFGDPRINLSREIPPDAF